MIQWMRDVRIHAVLGAAVVTVGVWLAFGDVPLELLVAVGLVVAGFLAWRGTTRGHVWAWTSLLLGLASLTWPVVTMVRVSRMTAQPSDEQMGLILGAVVGGLFASVFWISFAWGIFRWVRRNAMEAAVQMERLEVSRSRSDQRPHRT